MKKHTDHVADARKVVEDYNNRNKNTVEKMVKNPNGKGFILQKIAVDPNAALLYKPKPRERKRPIQVNSKLPKTEKGEKRAAEKVSKRKPTAPKPKAVPKKRPNAARLPILPKGSKKRLTRTKKAVTLNDAQFKIKELMEQGKNHQEISEILGFGITKVRSDSRIIRQKFPDVPLTRYFEPITNNYIPMSDVVEKILEDLKAGKCNREIATAHNISIDSARQYTRRLRKEYPEIKLAHYVRELTPTALECVSLFEKGLTVNEVAARRNRTYITIYKTLQLIKEKKGEKWIKKIELAQQKRQR